MIGDKPSPPSVPRWFFQRLLPSDQRIFLSGDFEEIYLTLLAEKGARAANRWYWRQCVQSLPRILARAFTWRVILAVNFIKVALRNLSRHKIYSIINVAGFAVGMAVFLAILLFIRYEQSYDRFHKQAERIYRLNTKIVMNDNESIDAVASPAVAPVIQAECPEIEKTTRLFKNFQPLTIRAAKKSFSEKRFFYADAAFFEIFSFPLLEGDPQTVFSTPSSLVLTESTARKYFPEGNAMGKVLTVIDERSEKDYIIKGVAADVPSNSHFLFDFLANLQEHRLSRINNWFLRACRTYVLLHKGASSQALESRFPPLIARGAAATFSGEKNFQDWISDGNSFTIFLQPLSDIHLFSRGIGAQLETNGSIAYVRLFGFIGLFMLLITVFNFVNMATARSMQRGREVGIRKVIGASRALLWRQFLLESILQSMISFILAVIILLVSMPALKTLVERDVDAATLLGWPLFPELLLGAVLIGVLAGFYPAFYLSGFDPICVLRSRYGARHRSGLRTILVVFQFTLSILITIIAATVLNQLQFVRSKDLGFAKNDLLALPAPPNILKRFDTFKAELKQSSAVANVSLSGYIPGNPIPGEDFEAAEGDRGQKVSLALMAGDEEFADTLGLKLIQGRFFYADDEAAGSKLVINQAAARKMAETYGWDSPIDKIITTNRETYTIIGVLQNFNFDSLHKKIKPMALLRLPPKSGPFVTIRLNPDGYAAGREVLEQGWRRFASGQPFLPISFRSETDKLYRSEQRAAKMISLFACLAVAVGCLGLFGLAAFTTVQRSQEIGIRKVLGAAEGKVAGMLIREHIRWVAAANIIAWPAAYIILTRWLESFAFRTNISLLLFFIAGGGVCLLACMTVLIIALKAAAADPVKALQYE